MKIIDVGIMDYVQCWDLQKKIHAGVVEGTEPETIIFVEHPPVITLGKNTTDIPFYETVSKTHDVPVVHIDRGGQATAHNPGQLVIYPIFNLTERNWRTRYYVTWLEEKIIEVLKDFGIQAKTETEFPGIWCGKDKICAIGLRVKDRVSMHGLALNVSNNLEIFSIFTPCGLEGRGVTSMSQLGFPTDMNLVKDKFRNVLSS